MDKTNVLENVVKLNIKSRPKSKEGKKKKNTYKSTCSLSVSRSSF